MKSTAQNLINETIRDIEDTQKEIDRINQQSRKRDRQMWIGLGVLFCFAVCVLIYFILQINKN